MRPVFFLVLSLASTALLAQDHGYTQAEIDAGALLYEQNCTVCHGLDGSHVAGIELSSGQFQHAATDEDLARVIQQGLPNTAMPPSALSAEQIGAIVAFLRTWDAMPVEEAPSVLTAAEPGDPQRGAALFAGAGQCLTCHWLNGDGSRLGPDLTRVGAQRNAAYLERALLEPNADTDPNYRFVLANTHDNAVITGRLFNRDTFSLQLLDEEERLVSLAMDDLRGFSFLNSPMPSFRGTLTDQQLADLISYLLTLRGDDQ